MFQLKFANRNQYSNNKGKGQWTTNIYEACSYHTSLLWH